MSPEIWSILQEYSLYLAFVIIVYLIFEALEALGIIRYRNKSDE
ncbi:hypothetical protein [Laceyella putida]|uniref:Uncharacterized protein n=1 Tax=Laceyella putida TaxID=110101 RepID=A0ABW2RMR4_9BACL